MKDYPLKKGQVLELEEDGFKRNKIKQIETYYSK